MTLQLLLLLPMLLLSLYSAAAGADLHPVILIPGAGGNRLEARLTTDHRPTGIICRLSALLRYRQWFPLWFDPAVLLPPLTRCFAEQIKLTYDASVDDFRNAAGVQTRVPDFGSTRSLLYLNSHLKQINLQNP